MKIIARRALFTALILLTALRGMVGDAMAYGMTGQMMNAQVAINSAAPNAYSMPATGQFSIKNVAPMPCHEALNSENTQDTAQAVCSTCQVCHLSVTLPFSAKSYMPTLPQADKPRLHVSAWASADRKLLSKPPLS